MIVHFLALASILLVLVLVMKAKNMPNSNVKDPTENVEVLEKFKVSPEKVERIIEGIRNKIESEPDTYEGEKEDLKFSITEVESMKDAYITENGYLCVEEYDKSDGYHAIEVYKISGISDLKKDDNECLGFDDFSFTVKNKEDHIAILPDEDSARRTIINGVIDNDTVYFFDVYEPSLYSSLNYYKWHGTFDSD